MSKFNPSRRRLIVGSMTAAAGLATLPLTVAGKSERIQITKVEVFRVAVPFKDGVVNSEEYNTWGWNTLEMVDQTPHLMLKVHTDSGIFGIGETARGIALKDAQRNVEYLVGKNVLDLNLPRLDLPHPRSAEGFEIALYDIVGKAVGWPVYQLLGGLAQEKVAVNYWCGRKNVEDIKRVAERCVAGGFKVLKMKSSFGDPVAKSVAAVATVAPDLKVNVDFNTYYPNTESFLPLAREMDAIGNMHTFEDPIPRADLLGYYKLTQLLKTPITLTFNEPWKIIEAAKSKACAYINTYGKPSLAQFVLNSAVAGAAGMPVWHGSGCNFGVMDASFTHKCAASPNATLPSDILSYLRKHTLLVSPLEIADGYVTVPHGPGLGVEMDEDAIRRYAV